MLPLIKNSVGLRASFIVLFSSVAFTHSLAQSVNNKLREEVAAMAGIGTCRAGAFLADGKEIVFISNLSGSPQIWKVPSSGGWPVQLTAFSDPVTAMSPSPNGDLIALLVAPGGGLNAQIYLMKTNGSEIRQVTKGGKTNNFLGVWSHDGSLLSFSSTEQNTSGVDFFLYNVKEGNYALAVKNSGTGGIIDFSEDNEKILFLRLASRGSNDVYLYDRASKSETLLTKHEGPGTFFGLFSPSGEIYLASNLNRDLVGFGKHEKNSIRILSERKNAELADFEINHAGSSAALLWNEAGRSKLSLFDIKSGKEAKDVSLPVELISSIAFSNDDKTIIFTGSGAKQTVNVWTYSIASDLFKKITDSPHPGVDLNSLTSPELITMNSFDGLEISGWLYRPSTGRAPYATVISYHGGPEGQSVPSFSSLAQALLKQGIAYFLPNVRGSSGFGKTFVNLDNGPLRSNGVKDIKAVSDFLIKSGISDKNALGIIGGSYGGYMVMAGVTEYPEMFAAGVNLFGVVNFETFFKNTEPWMAKISTIEYGDPVTQADMLRSLSPIHKASVIRTPLLVEHGANDTNVPVIEAEQVVNALKENNVPVKYTLFPDEGHGWQKTNNRLTSTIEIVEWFVQYLQH